ncbi:glycerol kinase GlpK [Clostridium grantii]|uniref:Glycerol kinase n=1 Tax=Clostridium grantii DSM 8605 TaxID=1121316 RepID=A0A1M5QNV8_9CLOT|nr:glycerol kinase GlpK [Clostridium grantii]SHH15782.1 glycerol kinase [Clostridium grantii DSM 8605]
MEKYIMALDQGTSSSRCILFNHSGEVVAITQKEVNQIYPKAGWVEHDPIEIWTEILNLAKEALNKVNATANEIASIGITNQRETIVVWNKNTGKPIYNAIVWQCRRTAEYCDNLREKISDEKVKEKTGLVIDAYFSGSKINWILENVERAREQAEKEELLCGTIDTWLIWNLTKGKVHITDHTNASRTMIYNIHKLEWDKELLSEMNIPISMLPEVKPSSCIYGETDKKIFGENIKIAGDAGDQQAALFGQTCFKEGMAKNTFGTGCFLLMNTGSRPVKSKHGLLTTIAASTSKEVDYALEGSVFVGGAVIQWLRDELTLIETAPESEKYCESVDDTNGVYLVPAFVGIGAPYWDAYARGTMMGLTRGTRKEHIIRAAVESMAYQTYDVLVAMSEDSGIELESLKVDGGGASNNFLMQFQASLLKIPVERPKVVETTALGAAYLAGLAVGYWKDKEELSQNWTMDRIFKPSLETENRQQMLAQWHRAVNRSLGWLKYND